MDYKIHVYKDNGRWVINWGVDLNGEPVIQRFWGWENALSRAIYVADLELRYHYPELRRVVAR